MGLALASKVGIVVLAGARTPIGSFGGMLKDVPGYELGAVAAREALSGAGVAAEDLDEVVMGVHRPGRPRRLQRTVVT
jgi:acetyl-CoA acetyltransferase